MTSPYGVLSRITNRNKAPAGSARSAGQGCEMCSEPIAEPHQHVVLWHVPVADEASVAE